MTAPVSAPAPTAQPTGGNAGNGERRVLPPRPFIAGTRYIDRQTYDETKTLTTASQTMRVYEVEPNGFLGGAYIIVQATTSGNSANVAFHANAPWNVLSNIMLNDVNAKPLVGPVNGHELAMIQKYGGYSFCDDPRVAPFSHTTGTGATGGSFTFVLLLPVEIVHRDGLGAVPNKSSSSTYDISFMLAPSTSVYSVAPTAQPTVRVRIQQYGWMDPNATDMLGRPVAQNPPAVQTTQFWTRQSIPVNPGNMAQRIAGVNSLVRNMIFYLTDSNGSRTQGDSDFPDTFTLQYETAMPVNRLKLIWQHMIAKEFGYTGSTPDTAGARDYGVYPLWFNNDFGLKPGAELRLGYLPVSASTSLIMGGTITGTGAHDMVLLVNSVVPANSDPMALSGR